MMTSTSALASAWRMSSGIRRSTSLESALRASGRLSVIVAIRSETSISTQSSAMPDPRAPKLLHRGQTPM
jgi:hypothetical protein